MRLDLTITDADLQATIEGLASYREYLLALLANLEGRKGGYDAAEALPLLARSNALERVRLSLIFAMKIQAMTSLAGDDLEQTMPQQGLLRVADSKEITQ